MILTTGTITANQLTFGYLEAGNGPLILALHGFPDHARSFRHQAPAFAAAGYRLVAPFLRGYKPTDAAPDGIYHLSPLVQDTIALQAPTTFLCFQPHILCMYDKLCIQIAMLALYSITRTFNLTSTPSQFK